MDKLDKLAEMLQKTETKTEFDIVDDLGRLQRLFGVIKAKDYKKLLASILQKYQNSEITEIRAALVERCRRGDTNAIRLYCDYFKTTVSETEDDGLLEALTSRAKEVFTDDS